VLAVDMLLAWNRDYSRFRTSTMRSTPMIWSLIAMRDSAYNRDLYPDAHARWSRSWQCQRCGKVFLV
jgi:hypothetical protein